LTGTADWAAFLPSLAPPLSATFPTHQ
jgi:hypothetical protein